MSRLVPWDPSRQAAYARFAAACFGEGAYQGRRDFLGWLTRDREADILLAVDGATVVGCVHRMRMPWALGDERFDVAAVVNLMVAPEHRTGTGLRLFAAAFAGERHAFVPAASDVTAEMCRRLNWRAVPARWYRRIVRPGIAQIVSAVRRRAARVSPPPTYALETDPDEATIAAVAATLRRRPDSVLGPAWDADLVRWRFFGRAPHLLVGRPPWDHLALLSVGPRRHLMVGRIVELRAPRDRIAGLAAAATDVLARAGAHAVTLVTSDETTQTALEADGWRPPPTQPGMFVFHKKRLEAPIVVGGGAGDFGLEAFVAR